MKRILSLAVFALLFIVGSVHAADTVTATMGDYNSSNVYRLTAYTTTSSTGVNYGWLTFAADTGVVYPYQAYTVANTPDQLITADSGSTVVDYGGVTVNTSAGSTIGSGSTHILPPCSTSQSLGNTYTVVSGSRSTVTVDPYGTDAILKSISGTGLSAGDKIISTGQAGDSITVQCVGNAVWAVTEEVGAWTDGN